MEAIIVVSYQCDERPLQVDLMEAFEVFQYQLLSLFGLSPEEQFISGVTPIVSQIIPFPVLPSTRKMHPSLNVVWRETSTMFWRRFPSKQFGPSPS